MQAKIGVVGQREIVEVRGANGEPPYVVCFSDGHGSHFPESKCSDRLEFIRRCLL
ncbi:uncharacterized protein EURHEDRAFT_416299 [Aspergillus ruber CBS 135680]|uniref:DUF1918 domain-containing protein n=1 Tax=Aspergillus ruber (strain CBS 135680) TaxID=1388766 RepID=A0A017S3N6_ASPRC|nr:uncharacterized protein EURHEDRAFT_416299 [Aspergillus ruber CBS 135680]EYE91623.1 hypothetical protein EURHEDRAFT_416299 [Aspergillus ruber CBS 135680]